MILAQLLPRPGQGSFIEFAISIAYYGKCIAFVGTGSSEINVQESVGKLKVAIPRLRFAPPELTARGAGARRQRHSGV
jgi:hypothetical protein